MLEHSEFKSDFEPQTTLVCPDRARPHLVVPVSTKDHRSKEEASDDTKEDEEDDKRFVRRRKRRRLTRRAAQADCDIV